MEFNFSLLLIGAGTLWAMRVVVLYLSGQAMIRWRTRQFEDPNIKWDATGELSNALLTPLLIAFAATLIAMDYVLRRELGDNDPVTTWLLGMIGTNDPALATALGVVWSLVWWAMLVWVSYITSLQAAHSYAMVLLRRGFDLSQQRPPHIALPLMLNVLIDTIWLPLLLNLENDPLSGVELLSPYTGPLPLAVLVITGANLTIAIWFWWRLWSWTTAAIARHKGDNRPPDDPAGSSPSGPPADSDQPPHIGMANAMAFHRVPAE